MAKVRTLRRLFCLVPVALLALGMAGSVLAQERHALVAEVDGVINGVTQRYIARAIEKGEEQGSEVVIIKLDTPGGLLDSTQKIVKNFLNAHVPTVVYIPRGARADSAGTFITTAANFAVMAPGTRIGAASPVAGGGEDLPETLKSKAFEATAALARSIAQERNRNADALEETVRNAKSYDPKQAVELGVVDFVAQDVADLLRQIDGRTVETVSGPRTLNTRDLALREINMSVIDKFLFFLADPNVSFILLSLGGLGLVIELFSPGLIIPGVVGAILLLLAFLGLGNLPVNWAAVGFILLAGVLLVAELFVSGFGILGIGAIVSFIFGGLLLFSSFGAPSPTAASIGVSLWLLGSLAGILTLFSVWFLHTIVQSRRERRLQKPAPSPLIGTTGVVTTDLAPRGTVHVAEEIWTAVTEDDTVIKTGERIRVIDVKGTILTVARVKEMAM